MKKLYHPNPAYAPALKLDKKLAQLTPDELDTFARACADVLAIAEMVPKGVEADSGHAILAAIYLKSLGRSPVNVLTEFEIDRRAFVADLGRVLSTWIDRVGEMKPEDAPGNVVLQRWKAFVGPLFLDPQHFHAVSTITQSWLAFNRAMNEDRNRMVHFKP